MGKMKLLSKALGAGLAVAVLLGFQPPASAGAAFAPHEAASSKRLLWHQEFTGRSGTKPSSRIFNYDVGGGGWGNNEHQSYTNYNATLNGSGQLVIKLNRITPDLNDLYDICPIDTPGGACEFESSRIQTKGKLNFKYGRLEARIKVPVGDGTWPAFWLLGSDISSNAWPNCGEIDIMETKGSEPYTVHGTAHGPGYSGGDGVVNTTSLSSRLGSGYHTYAIEWTPNRIRWYIDSRLYHTVTPSIVGNHTYVFNKPMFLILNVAAGGWFAGDIDPDLNLARMYVDYIRFYSIGGYGSVTGSRLAIAAGRP
jgi:beta-glucanase (GH16 family)